MSLTLLGAAVAVSLGFGLGVGAAAGIARERRHTSRRARMVARDSLEEGFRTFIDHHTDTDRDSEEADSLWRMTLAAKASDRAADDFAEQLVDGE